MNSILCKLFLLYTSILVFFLNEKIQFFSLFCELWFFITNFFSLYFCIILFYFFIFLDPNLLTESLETGIAWPIVFLSFFFKLQFKCFGWIKNKTWNFSKKEISKLWMITWTDGWWWFVRLFDGWLVLPTK